MAVSVSFTGRIQNVLEQLSLTKTWGYSTQTLAANGHLKFFKCYVKQCSNFLPIHLFNSLDRSPLLLFLLF